MKIIIIQKTLKIFAVKTRGFSFQVFSNWFFHEFFWVDIYFRIDGIIQKVESEMRSDFQSDYLGFGFNGALCDFSERNKQ